MNLESDHDGGRTTRRERSVVVGLDLVSVAAIVDSIATFGDRFLDRVFTPRELLYCLADARVAPARLAARFAAKEAVMKVLRVDDEAVTWRSIEVTRTPGGACELSLTGPALALAQRAGVSHLSLSMSHALDHAGAVVIGERPHTTGDT